MGRQLTQDQRGRIAEKTMEWGNLVFAGLVVAQMVPGTGPFRSVMVLVGIVSMAGAYALAYLLMKGGD